MACFFKIKNNNFDQSEQNHKVNNLLIMIPDFKKNTLANIAALTKKVRRIKPIEEDKQKNILFTSIVSDIQLLRNDVLLVLKHNFYLQCKLNEQSQQLCQLDKKYTDLEAHLSLQMAMLKQKYEKQIQQLKFNRFMTNLEQSPLRFDFRRHSSDSKDEELKISTRRKDIILQQEPQQQNLNSQTAVKFKKYQEMNACSIGRENIIFSDKLINEQQQKQNHHQFDLKLRVDEFQGVMSEQLTASKPSLQMIKSVNTDNFEQSDDRRRYKKVHANNQYRQKEQMQGLHKKKSEQLAQLVAQQFKISKIKQTYFSKDL